METADACTGTDRHGLLPAARSVSSPDDPDVHPARTRITQRVGYEVHLTEVYADDAPNLITHVETTPAPVADGALPRPSMPRSGTSSSCQPSTAWTPGPWMPSCSPPAPTSMRRIASGRPGRTSSGRPEQAGAPRRSLTIRPEARYHPLRAARHRERTPGFAALYRRRAGIEGTLSQVVGACRLRRTRSIGRAKTHLGHILTTAVNLPRIGAGLAGTPRATPRQSACATLMTPA